MRDVRIVREMLEKSLPKVHKRRLDAVFFGVESLLVGGRLSLTAIGRAARGRVAPKHNIKRIDRLLGNAHLHDELPLFFGAITQALIGPNPASELVILVDWTRLEDSHCALTAAVPIDGRAIPIYWEVYEGRFLGYQKFQLRFVEALAQIVPSCRAIVVTDAGFGTAWFNAVEKQGWDWMVRLGEHATFVDDRGTSKTIKSLYRTATDGCQDLGIRPVLKGKRQRNVRLVLGKRWRRAKRRKPNAMRRDARGRLPAERTVKRSCDPWALATSARHLTAAQVIAIYATRMQIEEAYRDAKNFRFGWCLRHARSGCCRRFSVLLLLASLAMFVVTTVGQAAETLNLQRKYQANTLKERRVLSLFFLGNWVMRRDEYFLPSDLLKALNTLRKKAFRHLADTS